MLVAAQISQLPLVCLQAATVYLPWLQPHSGESIVWTALAAPLLCEGGSLHHRCFVAQPGLRWLCVAYVEEILCGNGGFCRYAGELQANTPTVTGVVRRRVAGHAYEGL